MTQTKSDKNVGPPPWFERNIYIESDDPTYWAMMIEIRIKLLNYLSNNRLTSEVHTKAAKMLKDVVKVTKQQAKIDATKYDDTLTDYARSINTREMSLDAAFAIKAEDVSQLSNWAQSSSEFKLDRIREIEILRSRTGKKKLHLSEKKFKKPIPNGKTFLEQREEYWKLRSKQLTDYNNWELALSTTTHIPILVNFHQDMDKIIGDVKKLKDQYVTQKPLLKDRRKLFTKWWKNRLLPYFDLKNWAEIENSEIPDHQMGEWLWPAETPDDTCVDEPREKIQKTTKKYYRQVFDPSTLKALP